MVTSTIIISGLYYIVLIQRLCLLHLLTGTGKSDEKVGGKVKCVPLFIMAMKIVRIKKVGHQFRRKNQGSKRHKPWPIQKIVCLSRKLQTVKTVE